jgi:putative transposase
MTGAHIDSRGRPKSLAEISELVVRMAEENRTWGYRRIQGAVSNLGHALARTTIANILKRNGIEPVPDRNRKITWKEFLNRHWDQLVASDFFTVEVWTSSGLARFVVLFFMDLSTRRVEIGGIARQWIVDESVCKECDRCNGWSVCAETLSDPGSRSVIPD